MIVSTRSASRMTIVTLQYRHVESVQSDPLVRDARLGGERRLHANFRIPGSVGYLLLPQYQPATGEAAHRQREPTRGSAPADCPLRGGGGGAGRLLLVTGSGAVPDEFRQGR